MNGWIELFTDHPFKIAMHYDFLQLKPFYLVNKLLGRIVLAQVG